MARERWKKAQSRNAPCFFWKCTKRKFAERLRKPTRTVQVGYAEHGSKSSIEGTYAEAARRLRRACRPHFLDFLPTRAQVQSKKAQLKWSALRMPRGQVAGGEKHVAQT